MSDNQDDRASKVQETAGAFEALSISNGNTLWDSSALEKWLGYVPNSKGFKQAISRAMTVCHTLKIPSYEHFKEELGGFQLTRFACYLIAMNGDQKKPQVAQAQVYFAQMADIVSSAIESADNMGRVYTRQKISEGTVALNAVAHKRNVENYGLFLDAGYMGMYNMGIRKLRQVKGLPHDSNRSPMDFMGERELAANLFRITETEGRIQSDTDIQGQKKLEDIARTVGEDVRKVMEVKPEELAHEVPADIKIVHKGMKQDARKLQKIDNKKRSKKR